MPQQSVRERTADLPQLLRQFVRAAKPQGAWLGINRGVDLMVAAVWHGKGLRGMSFVEERNAVLKRMFRTGLPVVCPRGGADWAGLPHAVPETSSYWACFPLMRERRAIGAVGLWGAHKLLAAQTKQLRHLARQLAPGVEVISMLALLATELKDATTSGTPVGGASTSAGLPRAAGIVLRHLARTFSVPVVSLFAADSERHLVYEFRSSRGRITSVTTPLAGRFAAPERADRGTKSRSPSPTSTSRTRRLQLPQFIPLSYRGETVGALALSIGASAVPPEYAEALSAAVSRPLASLIENGRLGPDSPPRSGRLALIRDLAPQVIGVVEPREVAQIAASRISQHFGHEATRLVLIDRGSADLVTATVGAGAAQGTALSSFIVTDPDNGMASQVLRNGRSILVNGSDLSKAMRGKAGPGHVSYACVALNQGGHILGIIELRSPRIDAFNADDLHDLECGAAIVAAVISAASRNASSDNAVLPFRPGTTPSETRITSQRLPENRLVQAAKLMSVGEMAAGIAHELNNPLTTVAGFAELLLDEIAPDAPFRADVEMVMQEAQRARGVVRRLLDFARQGEGVRSRADIGEILEDVLALTTHFIHTSGVKLEIGLAKDMPWVLVDSNQMKQVFLNLIHNALQAMPAGGKLQVRTEVSQSDDRQWVVVRITDNGLGIRPADISRIFEPFFTTRAQHGGTGLGLSVSYGIVADHGGKIEVESQPGVGSTFSVWLPA